MSEFGSAKTLMSEFGTSQPWQLPRRTAGQTLALSRSMAARARARIAELDQEIERLRRTEETVAPMTSVRVWIDGIVFSIVFGWVTGVVFGLVIRR
jgi:hypothetical protein